MKKEKIIRQVKPMSKKFVTIMIYFIFSSLSLCEATEGSTGWWIFRKPQSTTPKSINSDLSGVFYNPSVLGTLQERKIFMLTELGLGKDSFSSLLYGQPLKIGKGAGIAAGVIYYDAGKETLHYIEGGMEKVRRVSMQTDLLGIISYGQKLSETILAGASIKLANSNIAEVKSGNAIATDLGMLFLPSQLQGLVFSVVAQNLGASTKFINKKEELPISVWLGTSYATKLRNSYLNFGVELPYIIKEKRTLPSVGIEYRISPFAVNLGYRFGADDSLLHVGFSIATRQFDFGYLFIPATYLSDTHRISMGYRF